MSEEDNNHQQQWKKTVTNKSVQEDDNKKVYTVIYDHGTSDTHVESKKYLVASRLSRLADFIKNAKPGDIKPTEDNQEKTENKNISIRKK